MTQSVSNSPSAEQFRGEAWGTNRVGCGLRTSGQVPAGAGSRIALTGIVLLAASCNGLDSNATPGMEATGARVVDYHAQPEDSRLASVANRLKSTQLRWIVGEPSEHGGWVWGRPESVAQHDAGHFVVLDGVMRSLVFISNEGQVSGSIGRGGGGPLEFEAPVAVASGNGNDLLVAQGIGGPIVLSGDGVETLRERLRLRGVPGAYGVCTLHGTAYVRINSPSLNEYQVAAIPIEQEGTPAYFSASSLPQDMDERLELAAGQVSCSAETGRILVTYKDLPYVHAFTPDGELAWESKIAPFSSVRLERSNLAGMPGLRRDHSIPSDIVLSSYILPGGFLLVQVGRVEPLDAARRKRITRRDTYLFSAATGDGVYVGRDVPHTIFGNAEVLLGVFMDRDALTPELRAYAY